MVEKNKLLSDLLDENCNQADLDDLLNTENLSETWYRYNTVSSILKGEHSANASLSFCSELSAKISEEPAIISIPKSIQKAQAIRQTAEIRRIGGGFAIAASVALATFFSFQTIQVADNSSSSALQTADTKNNSDSLEPTAFTFNEDEQNELELFNAAYLNDFRRSDKGKEAPVSGEIVRTVRLSAEEWQALLAKSLAKQKELEEAKQKELEGSEQQ